MFKLNVESGEIFLYDAIGDSMWGMIDAAVVTDALDQLGGKRATIRINSPGGSVDEGVAIYNLLENYSGGVDIVIDSIAASIASVIALAGDTRTIAENGMVMVHNASTIAWGDSRELRRWADVLDKYGDRIVKTYARKTKQSEKDLRDWMNNETWMGADEALARGFVTAISAPGEEPKVPKGLFQNAPKNIETAVVAGSRNAAPYRTAAEVRLAMQRMKSKFV